MQHQVPERTNASTASQPATALASGDSGPIEASGPVSSSPAAIQRGAANGAPAPARPPTEEGWIQSGAIVVGLPVVEESYYKDNAIQSPLVHRVETFARQKIGSLSKGFAYHCVEHTEMVVHNARAVGAAMKLTSAQLDLLISSAWLHDVGFTVTYLGHEEEGCRMAESLLGSDMSVEDMAVIKEAIMSTEIPQNGRGLVSQVLCDADLFYLGTNLFFPWSDRLRDEHRNVLNITYTEVEWIDVNLDFIRDQHFYTDFARDYCAQGCALHLRMLEEMRAEAAL